MLQKMLRTGAVFAVTMLGITTMSIAADAVAQQATPTASSCATTTPDENAQIVQKYIDAVNAGDKATADQLLADDFQHDLSMPGAQVQNLPGNADELQNIDVAAQSSLEVTNMVAQGDWVALTAQFNLSGDLKKLVEEAKASATPAAGTGEVPRMQIMAMVQIKCGMIADAQLTSNALRVLLSYGWQLTPPEKSS